MAVVVHMLLNSIPKNKSDCTIKNFNFIFQLFSAEPDFSMLNLFPMNSLNSLTSPNKFHGRFLKISMLSCHLYINILLFPSHSFSSYCTDWNFQYDKVEQRW